MKTLVAIPMFNTVCAPFLTSLLGVKWEGQVSIATEVGSLIQMARSRLAYKAIEGGFDRILWLDSDMTFSPDIHQKLVADMEEHDLSYVCGIYFKRVFPTAPVLAKSIIWEQTDYGINHDVEVYTDYPKDSLFEIAASGMGCCLMKTAIIKKAAARFGMSPFEPLPGMGEDFSFCWRLGQMGVKMYCDSRIKAGHAGMTIFDESVYLRQLERDNLHG